MNGGQNEQASSDVASPSAGGEAGVCRVRPRHHVLPAFYSLAHSLGLASVKVRSLGSGLYESVGEASEQQYHPRAHL